ncbi:hypothetical protein CH63R_05709 [Colletotrichum higginsianum IMI 349063]|uniref:Secreted protein n=2 Tax=Colletotrichum higginsianum TaxID=80884 RepID=A0A1B7YDB6_COLHI|nr:hypothetical protein CH63R_05709 [Colletotrichum higginsianum IMI 349063]OBR10017.1 hypothetical protein CH63R_05709 [Colletotrichum higginsianum IMI 349063]TID07109.1 hypothetical protein CH35J_001409 [Colletotrichum higginsianum]
MNVYSTRAHVRVLLFASSLCMSWPWRYCKCVYFVPVKYLVDLVENQGTRYEQGGYGKPGILPARLVRATQMPCAEYLGVPIYE